jgi:hypothetical protein
MATVANSVDVQQMHHKAVLQQETRTLVLQVPDKALAVKIDSGVPGWVSPSIQIVVSIIAAAVSVGTILWQMRKQRELTLEQQKKETKAQLRLEAYREFQRIYAEFNVSQKPAVEIRLILAALQTQLHGIANNIPVIPIQYREQIFRNLLNQLSNNAIELVFFLERHAPLLPGFEVFKLAFGAALDEIRQNYIIFQSVLFRWLPIDNPNYSPQSTVPPFLYCPTITTEAVSEFQENMEPILKSLGRLECWASDLSIELQNHLLGDYADQNVAHRIPIDLDYFVVTSSQEQREELTRYFHEETEYGRKASAAEAWARNEQLLRKSQGI